jgi:FkbM family methyltransferase
LRVQRFLSHAQNFEDVMIRRCFRRDVGFYVDVGAHDPDVDSVTRSFYDLGWSGINIDPLPRMAARLAARRPRDITLECAVASTAGRAILHDIDDSGGVSTLDGAIARDHAAHGWQGYEIDVEVRTLSDILDAHLGDHQIDFLKIDVEGFELEVLKGADFRRHPATLLILESRNPVSIDMVDRVDEVHDRFEEHAAYLGPFGYSLVFRDGTNSFYLAADAMDLARHFTRPPGVFDMFVHVNSLRALYSDAQELEQALQSLR